MTKREWLDSLGLRLPAIATDTEATEEWRVAIWPLLSDMVDDELKKDFVQVVRCKDCTRSQYDELFHMRWCNGEEVKDDDFCSYGERKDRKKGADNE